MEERQAQKKSRGRVIKVAEGPAPTVFLIGGVKKTKNKKQRPAQPKAVVGPQSHFPREYIEGKKPSEAVLSKPQGSLEVFGLSPFAYEEISLLKRRFRRKPEQWMNVARWKEFSEAQREELRAAMGSFQTGKLWLNHLDSELPSEPSPHPATSTPDRPKTASQIPVEDGPAPKELRNTAGIAPAPHIVRPSAPDLGKPVPHTPEYEAEMRARREAEQDQTISVSGPKPAPTIQVKTTAERTLEPEISPNPAVIYSTLPTAKTSVQATVSQQDPWKPAGSRAPSSTTVTVTQFKRCASVKEWVLANAKGICECCKREAPFKGADGLPFLEVHHVRQLTDSGTDTVSNTVALCPNCHRELHFGARREMLVLRLYETVPRLVVE